MKMQRRIATLFIGLILLGGFPLAITGMVDTFTKEFNSSGNVDSYFAAAIESKTLKNADTPIQQGDLRNLKHTSQKVRISNSNDDLQCSTLAGFSYFIHTGYFVLQAASSAEKTAGPPALPIFLRNRVLVI